MLPILSNLSIFEKTQLDLLARPLNCGVYQFGLTQESKSNQLNWTQAKIKESNLIAINSGIRFVIYKYDKYKPNQCCDFFILLINYCAWSFMV